MKKILVTFFAFAVSFATIGQVFDYNDPIVEYDPDNPPIIPQSGTPGKWVRTKRLNWNTDAFKAYFYNGMAFRLRYPENYDTSGNTKYPVIIMMTGRGEKGEIYDNEINLKHAARDHENDIKAGRFNGFLLFPQSSNGFWGDGYFTAVNELVTQHMPAELPLDPDRIVIHGLSAGGQAVWNFISTYPKTIAAALPMSAASSNYYSGIQEFKHIPIWLSQGGQDRAPSPFTSRALVDEIVEVGGNIRYTVYPNGGHGIWGTHYNESDFWPYLERAHKTVPVLMTGELGLMSISSSREVYEFVTKDEICPGDPIYAKLGLTAGFEAYEWRKDGIIISGATSNELVINEFGVYDARFRRNGEWSKWSVRSIEIKQKGTTVTPDIGVSGLSSIVIPDAAGKDYVDLELPEGFLTYEWVEQGSAVLLSNDRIFRVTEPGLYRAKVTENFGCDSEFGDTFEVLDSETSTNIQIISVFTANALSKTEIQLDWSLNPLGDSPEQIEIYRSVTDENNFELIDIISTASVRYTDTGLNADEHYFYFLRPVNNTGAAPISETRSARTAIDSIAPTAPLNLRVLRNSSSDITVTWEPSTDDVGVFKYDVYKDGIKSVVVNDTQATLFGLNEEQIYSIQVKARDFAGNESAFSNMVVSASVYSGLFYEYYEGTWNSLPDFNSITPVQTGQTNDFDVGLSQSINHFAFYFEGYINIPVAGSYTFETRSDDGSKLYIGGYDESNLVVDNDGLHGMRYREGTYNFATSGNYLITVTFFEKEGNEGLEVYWKNTAHGVGSRQRIPTDAFASDFTIPNVEVVSPNTVSAAPLSYDQIQLNWTDNNSSETWYQVFRNVEGSSDYIPVGTVEADNESFVDSNLEAATTYNYQVIALSQLGASDQPRLPQNFIGNINSGIAAQDNASGTGFIMFSATNVFDRFSSNPPINGNSNFLIAVKYSNGQWMYDNNSTYYPFVPVASDVLLAEVDFSNDQIFSLENVQSDTLGILKGFNSNHDLQFFANRWNGGNNNGEFTVTGTYFERTADNDASATTSSLPPAPNPIQNFSATVISSYNVEISWDAVTNADTYRLMRSLDGSNFLETLTQSSNAKVLDSELAAHTEYYYILEAINVGGSTYSDTLLVTTLNDGPILDEIEDFTIRYSSYFGLQLYASDGNNDPITLSAQNLPSFAVLSDYGDGTGLIEFSPEVEDEGIYNDIIITASDGFNGIDSDTLDIEVNNNFIPTLSTISNVSLSEGDMLDINIVAQDPEGTENLLWSSENLPAFATLMPAIDGNSNLQITPGFSDHGIYSDVKILVEDQNGAVASQTFEITVMDKDPNQSVKINLHQGSSADTTWNNLTGLGVHNLNDVEGQVTNVSFQLLTNSWASFNQGAQTGNDSGVFPDAVLKEYYYFGIFGAPETVDVKISGLDGNTKYDFKFVGSSTWTGVPDNGSTQFMVNDDSAQVNVQGNFAQSADLIDIEPDPNGEVIVTMSKTPGTPVGYLNGMTIMSKYGSDDVPAPPKNLIGNIGQGVVELTWLDAPYNEEGFNVYRSEQSEGPYSQVNVNAISANTEYYEDNTVAEGVAYYYIVTAFNLNGESIASNEAEIFVPDTPPIITISGSTTAFANQTSELSVLISDPPNNNFSTSILGLPDFGTFTPTPTGGNITLNPSSDDIGNYSITIEAVDENSGYVSETINFLVSEQLIYTVNLNFSKDFNQTGWNNTAKSPNQGDIFSNLSTDLGANSGISVSLETALGGVYNEGAITGNDSGIVPDNVLQEYYYFGIFGAPDEITLKVSGLNYNNKYAFGFVGSSLFSGSGITDNGKTVYSIGNKTTSVNVQGNTENMGEITDVIANSSGEVLITISKGSGASVGYINALVIKAFEGDPTIFYPSDLKANSFSKSSIELMWTDNSFDELGFEIYRSDNGYDGIYNLIGSTSSDVTNFIDTGLSTGTIYHYKVRSIHNGNSYSELTRVTEGATIDYYIYVNVNGSSTYDALEPWNNLSTPALTGDTFYGFKNDEGQSLGLELDVSTGMQGSNDWGATSGDDSGIFPDLVTKSFYFNDRLDPKGEFLLKGLDLSLNYNITFFGSIVTQLEIATIFSANGQSVINYQTDNLTETSTIFGLSPDINGELLFTVQEASNSNWAIFNAFVVGAYPKSQSLNIGGRRNETTAANHSYEVRFGKSNVNLSQYPNPVTDELYLKITDAPLETLTTRLISTTGVIIKNNNTKLTEVNTELDLSEMIDDLKSGLYILNVSILSENHNFRIIKN